MPTLKKMFVYDETTSSTKMLVLEVYNGLNGRVVFDTRSELDTMLLSRFTLDRQDLIDLGKELLELSKQI